MVGRDLTIKLAGDAFVAALRFLFQRWVYHDQRRSVVKAIVMEAGDNIILWLLLLDATVTATDFQNALQQLVSSFSKVHECLKCAHFAEELLFIQLVKSRSELKLYYHGQKRIPQNWG